MKYPSATLIDFVLKKDLRGLQKALSHGADPNERSSRDRRTALIHAAIDGNLEFAKVLLEGGTDVNARDSVGYSALHYAAQNYLPAMATLLIAHGAEVDAEDQIGNTPLWRATFDSRGRGELISILLGAGADRNHLNRLCKTPLDLAKLIANFDVLQFFV